MVKDEQDTQQSLVLEMLAKDLEVTLFPKGGSMKPIIRDRERIAVRRVEPGQLNPSDLVLFARGAQLIVHRLIRMEKGTALLKGDCSVAYDEPLALREIRARVVWIEKGSGRIELQTRGGDLLNRALAGYSIWTTRCCLILCAVLAPLSKRIHSRALGWTYEVLHQVANPLFYPWIWFLSRR